MLIIQRPRKTCFSGILFFIICIFSWLWIELKTCPFNLSSFNFVFWSKWHKDQKRHKAIKEYTLKNPLKISLIYWCCQYKKICSLFAYIWPRFFSVPKLNSSNFLVILEMFPSKMFVLIYFNYRTLFLFFVV